MKKSYFFILLLFFVIFLFDIDPMYAGPGGTIAKAIFKTWWGKILLIALGVIFLPLMIYVYFREYFAVRKCKKQLLKLASINRDFSWLNLDKNVRNIFNRVYIAWNNEDLKEASSYISHWYWQNQQLVHLEQWKKENLRNICNVDVIKWVKPLYLEITDENNLEGSRIVFLIEAKIKDYLINRETNKVVRGSKDYGDEEKIWVLEYNGGKWLLDDIQEGNLSLAFAKMPNIVPETISLAPINHRAP